MSHPHPHPPDFSHDHNHSHAPAAQKTLIFVLFLTFLFFLIELLGGFWTGSIALLSDASHMFTDMAALTLSLAALRLSQRSATFKKTYGFHRVETLAAFLNASLLILISGGLFLEALQRWKSPQEIRSLEMIGIASLGFLINLLAFFLLWRNSHENLNMQGALLHVMGDTLGSLGALFAGIFIYYTHWTPMDSLVSVFICLLVLFSAWRLLWKSTHVLMEGVPEGVDQQKLCHSLLKVAGVQEICDLHIWSLNSQISMLTAHIRVQNLNQSQTILPQLLEIVQQEFKIDHATLQLEDDTCPSCGLIV